MDAGFLNVVEIGQYFMMKGTAEFSQFRAAACREYILPRDEEASQPKGWIQGNTKIGPVLVVATCCLHGKYGVDIRISSVNRDKTHSWVRFSHGSNKFVMNLNNNEQEIPEVQLEEHALKLDAKDFSCRSKAKTIPQRREPAGPSVIGIHPAPDIHEQFSVNGIHPAPDIHEHFTIHKGYGTLRISSRTTSTILSAL